MKVKMTLPAPHQFRWYEGQIAGMLGVEVVFDGDRYHVVFAGPVDGDEVRGTSAMDLTLEGPL